ncbi:DUF2637 domain-containing protein [Nonomuraea basaltis]|nr:DUF2637 domain-containing protein [Nonomuraea basaltis]
MVILLAGVAAVVSYRHAYEVVAANGESGWVAYLVPLTIDGLIFSSSMVLLDAARRSLEVPWLARFTLALGILATLAANVMHGWAHGPIGAIVAAWPAVALVLSYELLMGLIRRGTVTAVTVTSVTTSATAEFETVTPVTVESVRSDTLESADANRGSQSVAVAHGQHVEETISFPHGGTLDVETSTIVEDDVPAVPGLSPAPTPVLTPAPDELFPVAAQRFSEDLSEGRVPPLATIKKDLKVGQPRAKRIHTYLHLLAEVSR